MKNILLIDIDNIDTNAFDQLAFLADTEAELYFFVTPFSTPLPTNLLNELQHTGASLNWKLIETRLEGQYSMDFHIATHVIAHAKDHQYEKIDYFILSTDTVFSRLSPHLSRILERRVHSITTLSDLALASADTLVLTL